MQAFGEICKDCGGLRAKPNENYSWSGEFCDCPEEDKKPCVPFIECPHCKKSIAVTGLCRWDG